MRTTLLSCFFLLFFASLRAQTPTNSECTQFHEGTFTYKTMPNVTIERDSQYQIERNASDGTYVKMSITWTSDCTYELRLVETNKRKDKKAWKKMKVLVVTITYTDEDSYRFSCVSAAFTTPITGTIVKKK